jgi:hypothetical protein
VSGLTWAASLCLVAVVLALASFYWAGWSATPVTVRLIAGVTAFGVSPGLLLIGPFLSRRPRRVAPADFVISVITCSFSCNLVFNAVLFALKWSLADLTRAYLLLQLIGYLVWAASSLVHSERVPIVASHGRGRMSLPALAAISLLATAAAALVYITYVNGAPPTNPEELTWLRKLTGNPGVRFDNLSYRDGDPSTYLFVPFQILIAGTSVVAHADVALTYSVFWAVTTVLSLFMIGRLAYILFGRAEIAALVCLWMVMIGFFDPNAVVAAAGIVRPYPNRYGVAGGVLLPLVLVLFWSILRESEFQLWRWALLVYVTVEMTFVHARETTLAVGTMVGLLVVLAARPKHHRREVAWIAAVIGVTAVVLYVYKHVNLAIAPELGAYVGEMSEACRIALSNLIREHGFLGALVAPVPKGTTVGVNANAVSLNFVAYQGLFLDTWIRVYPGRLFLPLALVVLPLYAWFARSITELSLALVLAGLGAVASSGLLALYASAAVGNPEVLLAYNLIFLLSLLVLCCSAWRAGVAIANFSKGLPGRRWLLVGACVLLPVASYYFGAQVLDWRTSLGLRWTAAVGWALIAAAVIAIVDRLRRSDLPLFPDQEEVSAIASLASACLILAVVMPAVQQSDTWDDDPFSPEYPSYRFSGDFVSDYPQLMATGKLEASDYPLEVIRFLREGMPPNQTVFADDTLAILQRVPHFAAILSNKGTVPATYIANGEYLQTYSLSGTKFEIRPFLSETSHIHRFEEMLTRYGVDIVLVSPGESSDVKRYWEQSTELQARLRPVFERDGYLIYAHGRSTASP